LYLNIKLILAGKVRREAAVGKNCELGEAESNKLESQWMTFPIKRRINTELFIDRNKGLYKQKGNKEMDQ